MTQPRYGGSSGTGRRMQVSEETADKLISKRSKDQSGDSWAKQGAKTGASIGLAAGAVRGGIVGSQIAPLYGLGRAAGATAGAAGLGARYGAIGAGVGALGGLGVREAQKAGYRKQRAKMRKNPGAYQHRHNPDVRKMEPIAKRRTLRDYDSEDRRQRRLGMAQAATGAVGVAGLALGGRGVIQTTRAARKIPGLNGKDAAALELVRGVHRAGILASRRDLANIGGGTVGLAATGAIRQHAEDPRNRRYL